MEPPGFEKQENAASIRTGCKAMIRLLRCSDHGWYISRLCDIHNHEFSEGYAEKKQWNSHSVIDPTTKHFIQKLRENNVSIGMVLQHSEFDNHNISATT
ncbi:hypothetical protein C2845_PM17G11080 [Panicum miliaceum]|uniref:FAR1 domain-containing protein n=1 Tax=Panicum miliaceum TaxID=4540 RepID=A0A3L6Q1Q3_PANMI|nr:hypothetical protein C2845_PM17G11080 [Panicum miliaceum]